MRILPAITTTNGSDWKNKIKEAKEMNLKEVCFFLTCLDRKQREEFYKLAENSGIKEAPFAHIRNDMEDWEMDYLIKKYKTKIFNIHCNKKYPLISDYSKYRDFIYVENTHVLEEEELKKFNGICLDFSHLEDDRLMDPEVYRHNLEMLEKYPIGCNHISAVRKNVHTDQYGTKDYADHFFNNLSEFDYLKNYPLKYFSDYTALELENTLEDQLKAKEYILLNLGK